MSIPKGREDINEIQRSHFLIYGDRLSKEQHFDLFNAAPSYNDARQMLLFEEKPNRLKKMAWFIKLPDTKNDALSPPGDVEWINMISSNCDELIQLHYEKNNPPSPDDRIFDLAIQRAVFAVVPNEGKKVIYTFLGIYRLQPEKNYLGAQVYHRASEYLQLDDWDYAKAQEEAK
jgi:hypothetical protein